MIRPHHHGGPRARQVQRALLHEVMLVRGDGLPAHRGGAARREAPQPHGVCVRGTLWAGGKEEAAAAPALVCSRPINPWELATATQQPPPRGRCGPWKSGPKASLWHGLQQHSNHDNGNGVQQSVQKPKPKTTRPETQNLHLDPSNTTHHNIHLGVASFIFQQYKRGQRRKLLLQVRCNDGRAHCGENHWWKPPTRVACAGHAFNCGRGGQR